MDQVILFGWLFLFVSVMRTAIKSLMGKVSITSETLIERAYLFAIHAFVACYCIKPVIALLNKISGVN